ncbi:MAG: NAD(P)-dependent alcohol dehydrogenase [Acidobacteriaceae bacterium]
MKAIVYRKYGAPDVLKCEEIEKPAVHDNEVLIKVRAASLNPLDWRLMRGTPYFIRMGMGLRKPKEMRAGRDVAGEVEAIGSKITLFKPGDGVFGVCVGALAEYACGSESKLAIKPNSLSFDEAASIPIAGLTALQGLRDMGQIQPGQKVLVNGAAGGVGTFAVQIAKSFDAHVTGVCSTGNAALLRAIGADHVIDYTQEDFTKSKERYDLILDNVGNHPLSAYRRVLNPHGKLVMVGAKNITVLLLRALQARVLSWFVSQRLGFLVARLTNKDLAKMGELFEAGKVKPVIDRRYPLIDVPRAIAYLEEGHAHGKIVITPN